MVSSKVSKAYREPQTQSWDIIEDNDMDVGASGVGEIKAGLGEWEQWVRCRVAEAREKWPLVFPRRKLFH